MSTNISMHEWLTLKEASDFLGVHYATLRSWSDNGEIAVFRTPGGHRRFSMADLRRFLDERAGHGKPADSDAIMTLALGRIRREIERIPHHEMRWHYDLDEPASDARRQRGRELFALAIRYVVNSGQRKRILNQGRQLGRAYGQEAADSNVSLRDTGRAVQFFRSQLMQVLRSGTEGSSLDADDIRIQQLANQFLDEILYAVLDGYEEQLTGVRRLQTDVSSRANRHS